MSNIMGGLTTIGPIMIKIMYWTGYILFTLGTLTIVWIALYVLKFNYKMTVFPVVGNVEKGLTVDKPINNRVKLSKDQTTWHLLKPFFKGHTLEPFQSEYIYPGKRVYAFKIGESFVPARIDLPRDGKELSLGLIQPIPYYAKKWQKLELKQNEVEFMKGGFWEDNKQFIMAIATVAICCGLAAVTVYYTYQFAMGNRADVGAITEALKNWGGTIAPQ